MKEKMHMKEKGLRERDGEGEKKRHEKTEPSPLCWCSVGAEGIWGGERKAQSLIRRSRYVPWREVQK